MKKIFRYFFIFLLAVIVLIISALILIQIPAIQTKIIAKVLERVNQDFGTSISVGRADINYKGDIVLYDVAAKDFKNKDFISIKKLTANLNFLDIYRNSSDIRVRQLTLDKANVNVITYKGDSISNFIRFVDNFSNDKDTTESNFKLRGNLTINESKLAIINRNLPKKEQVWLDSRNLNGEVKNLDIQGSVYTADIKYLNFLARKNDEDFELKNFSSKFKKDDKGIYFNDLSFKTQSSDLNGLIHLNHDTSDGFSDFSNKVQWNIQLAEGDKLGFKDLRYFIPDWDRNEILDIRGNVTGTLNNLKIKDLHVANGGTFIKTNNVSFQDLLNGSYGVYSNEIKAKTSYEELVRILPTFLNKHITDYIKRFGIITYGGKLNINKNTLDIDGSLNSALGDAFLKLTMNDFSGDTPTYNGYLNTAGFDIGKLSEVSMLNQVAGVVNFSGKSFNLEKMELNADGKINYLDIAGQRYDNLTVDGVLKNQVYKGFLAINDPSKAKLNYEGSFDFSSKKIKADFISNIDYVNLNYFGVTTRKNSWVKTKVTGEATFSDIEDLQGNFTLEEFTFNSDTLQVNLPKSNIVFTQKENQDKIIGMQVPNYLSAQMDGNFKIAELGNIFLNGVGDFLVDYKRKPITKGQYLNYSVSIEDDFVNYLLPDLKLKPQTYATGRVIPDENIFDINISSPGVKYRDYSAQELSLIAEAGDEKSIHLKGKQANIKDFLISDITLDGKTTNDTLNAKMHFFAGENKTSEFDLKFYQTLTENKLMKIGFSPSEINMEGTKWQINPTNSIDTDYAIVDLNKNIYRISDFVLQSDEQYLKVNGEYINENNFNLQADIQNVLLQKVIPPSYKPELGLKGIANGKLNIKKENNVLEPIADLKIDSIQLDGRLIGNFSTEATYDIDNEIFNLTGSLDKNNLNVLFISGAINNKGPKPELDLVADLDEFDVDILGIFLDKVMTDWKGKLSGKLNVKGDISDPSIRGVATVKNMGFRVVYLGTYYQFQGENELFLNKQPGFDGQIELDNISFTETTSGTKGVVDGSLIFSDLSSWFLNLDFTTDKLLVMNTTIKDNELFYGKVYGEGEFFMFGPASDLVVSGRDLNVLPGSVLNLNTSGTKSTGENRFIQFYSVDENGDITYDEKLDQVISGFSLDLNLNVDSGSMVNIVLDEKADDKIRAQGYANNFKISMNRAGALNIDGEYIITNGVYNYREGVIVDKEFNIEKGGYVRFNGDPFNAQMNLKAIYSRIVNNLGDYVGTTYVQPTKVDLIVSIKGDLKDTNIDLGIEVPNANSQIKTILDSKIKNNIDERIRQVGSVLVLGRFDSNETLTTNTARDAATATAFELLGKQVGNVFSSVIPGLEINPTYLQSTTGKSSEDRIQTQFNWALNPRLKINGAIGTPLGSELNREVTTSVELDYDISKNADGGLRLRGFSRPSTFGLENYNVNTTYAQTYGLGIVYQRSFNSLRNLFRKKEEEIEEQTKVKNKPKAKKDTINKKVSFIKFNH
ncbi:translocation/assembly module TamB [Weeksellaceae bacterium TAE3-ERU29]|nr:translocation/assembly module TamB [Weeksellaceae bacterium TAE3-ERU29]